MKTDLNMIPVEFIEDEKQRVLKLCEDAAEEGNLGRAKAWGAVARTLEALVSNWIYAGGVEWRRTHEN